jgi:hypothetical protein
MKWFAFLQAVFFVTACTDKPQDTLASTHTLVYAKSIAYPLDSATAHSPLDLGLTPWNESIFYLTNRDLGRVHFYNAYTQEKIGYWHFTSDPRNKLSESFGLYLFGEDSLLVFHRPLVVSLFSQSKNEVIQRTFVELPMYEDSRNSFREASIAGLIRPIRVDDFSIIINLNPVISLYKKIDSKAQLTDYKMLSKINILKGEFEDLPIKFPSSTQDIHQGLGAVIYLAETKDYFLLGFQHDPILYKVDKRSEQVIGSFMVYSQYPVDFTPTKGITEGTLLGEFREKNYRYFQLIYDPYRRVFYRQVTHPNHDYGIGTRYYSSMDRPEGFSVMIFDEEFKKLGEVDFPPKTYGYQAWYVGPEGLYISKSNYNNPEMREDFMDFDLFVLKSLDE